MQYEAEEKAAARRRKANGPDAHANRLGKEGKPGNTISALPLDWFGEASPCPRDDVSALVAGAWVGDDPRHRAV